MWVSFYMYASADGALTWRFVPAPTQNAAESIARKLAGKPMVYSVGVSKIENVFKPDGA
jgi:hypothetical protein